MRFTKLGHSCVRLEKDGADGGHMVLTVDRLDLLGANEEQCEALSAFQAAQQPGT